MSGSQNNPMTANRASSMPIMMHRVPHIDTTRPPPGFDYTESLPLMPHFDTSRPPPGLDYSDPFPGRNSNHQLSTPSYNPRLQPPTQHMGGQAVSFFCEKTIQQYHQESRFFGHNPRDVGPSASIASWAELHHSSRVMPFASSKSVASRVICLSTKFLNTEVMPYQQDMQSTNEGRVSAVEGGSHADRDRPLPRQQSILAFDFDFKKFNMG